VPSRGGVSRVRNIGVIVYGAYREYILSIYGNINIILIEIKLNIYSLY